MRYFIAMMILCSTVNAEDIFKPTGRYAVQEQATIPDFVLMIKSRGCSPCIKMSDNELPKIARRGIAVTVIDCADLPPGMVWRGSITPHVMIIDGKTRKAKKDWVGYVTAETILQAIGTSKPAIVEQKHAQIRSLVSPPNRYIQWPGYGTIDLETYNRNCNCGMCQSIRAYQQEYRRQLKEYNQQPFKASQEATPTDVVDTLIQAMNLTPKDVVADLGCGDGRILIRAVQLSGCTGIGVEIDSTKAEEARTNVRASGLSGSIQIITADALDFEPAKHGVTAITAHLYEPLLEKLRPKLEQARIVATPYHAVPGMKMSQVNGVWIHENIH